MPGVEMAPFPGHTPGHACIRITSREQVALIVGDALHHPVQIMHPEWGSPIETKAGQAHQSRIGILKEVSDGRTLVLGAHWAGVTGLLIGTDLDGGRYCQIPEDRWFDPSDLQ